MFPSITLSESELVGDFSGLRIWDSFGSWQMYTSYKSAPYSYVQKEIGTSKSTVHLWNNSAEMSTSYIDLQGKVVGKSYSKFNLGSSEPIYTTYYKLDVNEEVKIGTSQTALSLPLNDKWGSGTASTTYYDLENNIIGTSESRLYLEKEKFPHVRISTAYNNLLLFFKPSDPVPPFRFDYSNYKEQEEKRNAAIKKTMQEKFKREQEEKQAKQRDAIEALTRFTEEIKFQISEYESERKSRRREGSQNRLDSTVKLKDLLKDIASNDNINNKFIVSVACVLNEIDLIKLDHSKQGILNRIFTHSQLAIKLEKAIDKFKKDIARQGYYLINRACRNNLIALFTRHYPYQPTADVSHANKRDTRVLNLPLWS